MVVLNPRCSLNHLAILPVHLSEVSDCSFRSTVSASAARIKQGVLGSRAASRPGSERVASLVAHRGKSGRAPAESSHGDFSDLPRRNSVVVALSHTDIHAAVDLTARLRTTSVFPDYATRERLCKRNTRLPLPPTPTTCPPHLRTLTATYRTFESALAAVDLKRQLDARINQIKSPFYYLIPSPDLLK